MVNNNFPSTSQRLVEVVNFALLNKFHCEVGRVKKNSLFSGKVLAAVHLDEMSFSSVQMLSRLLKTTAC